MNHGRLEMEAPVSQVEDQVRLIGRKTRRSAAENLPLAEWRDLWNQDFKAGTLENGLHGVEGGIELNSAYHGDGFAWLKVPL